MPTLSVERKGHGCNVTTKVPVKCCIADCICFRLTWYRATMCGLALLLCATMYLSYHLELCVVLYRFTCVCYSCTINIIYSWLKNYIFVVVYFLLLLKTDNEDSSNRPHMDTIAYCVEAPQLHHFGQIEIQYIDPPIYWYCNCLLPIQCGSK